MTMIGESLAIVFWTVFAALGFSTIFNLMENVGRHYASQRHLLGSFRREIPILIFMCVLMILMRLMNKVVHGSDINQYWLLINVQIFFLVYADLMVENIWTFLITKVFATISFVGTGGLTVVALAIFVVSGLTVFLEPRYTKSWSPDNPVLFMLPALALDACFWAVMAVTWHPSLVVIAMNYVGFACAIVVVFVNGRNQRADQQIVARLKHETQIDGLTGVRNWTMFQRDFSRAHANVKIAWPLGILAMDLDNFKMINDTYGHLAGNEALVTTATTLEKLLQTLDQDYHLYRTGGEEFAIILPHTDAMTAKKIGLDCQQAVRQLTITTDQGDLSMTASFGLTQALDKDRDATATFKRADEALYRSKQAGRDRLTINHQTLAS